MNIIHKFFTKQRINKRIKELIITRAYCKNNGFPLEFDGVDKNLEEINRLIEELNNL